MTRPDLTDLDQQETALRGVLHDVMTGTAAPSSLASRALLAGRRRRARRRVALLGGTVAACSAVALVVPLALGGAGTPGPVAPAAGSRTSPDVAVEPPAGPAEPAGWWAMPATRMLEVVADGLPEGVTLSAPGPLIADTPEGGPARGYVVPELTGPAGPGRLNVMLYPQPSTTRIDLTPGPTGGEVVADDCDAPELADSILPCTEVDARGVQVTTGGGDLDISCPGNLARRAECTELRAPDGTLVGRRSATTTGAVTTLEVVLRRDGGTVYAATANALELKWGRLSTASAPVAPLTLEQLELLVRDEAWTTTAP